MSRKPRLPHLGRMGKTVRNLLLALALVCPIWAQYGCPLPTAEMEFRRLERMYLCPPSELVFVLKEEEVMARDGTWLWIPSSPVAVGVADGRAVVGYSMRWSSAAWDTLDRYQLEEGPSLIPLGRRNVWWTEHSPARENNTVIGSALLMLNPPEETARGELEVDITYRDKEYHRSCPLWQLEDGSWLTAVETPDDGYLHNWYAGGAYTLRLYDAAGGLLLEQSGRIPEIQ